MNRPPAVLVLAFLAIVGGILSFLDGVDAVVDGALIAANTGIAAAAPLPIYFLGGAICLILGALYLVFCAGILRLDQRAWALGIGLQIAAVLTWAAAFALGLLVDRAVIHIILAAVILAYLFAANIRHALGRP